MDEASDDEGFWSFVRRTRPAGDFSSEIEVQIDKRQRRVCTKGFGISYEYITETIGWRSGDGGQYAWDSIDGFFDGVSQEEFDDVMGKFSDAKLELLEGEAAWDSDRPYKTLQHDYETLIPDHLFSEYSNLKTELIEGDYDIIFYAGEASQYFGKHHRTARGTVKISRNSSGRLTGNVLMHPCMDEIDVIPFGGNYSFVEKSRVQRGEVEDYDTGEPILPTGVVKIEVTDGPYGLCMNDGYDLRDVAPALRHMVPVGELRIFREKVGAGITNQIPGGAWDEEMYRSLVPFRNSEEAEALNRSHYERTCSWLHKYTALDKASSVHVGRFLCPPPVLFFEEGDIQLDIDWKKVAPGSCNANSSIIARRRTSSITNRLDLLTSDERSFKAEMSSVQLEIDKLERKKDMIWLAYECANRLREESNYNNPALVAFSIEDTKVKRCIMYMDRVMFNEQLSLYGLHLESMQCERNGMTYLTTRELTLSRI